MLVLTAKVGEKIYIGENTYILLSQISSKNQAKIGIEAPKSVKIIRESIYNKIDEELA